MNLLMLPTVRPVQFPVTPTAEDSLQICRWKLKANPPDAARQTKTRRRANSSPCSKMNACELLIDWYLQLPGSLIAVAAQEPRSHQEVQHGKQRRNRSRHIS